jgi:hypothetical protein
VIDRCCRCSASTEPIITQATDAAKRAARAPYAADVRILAQGRDGYLCRTADCSAVELKGPATAGEGLTAGHLPADLRGPPLADGCWARGSDWVILGGCPCSSLVSIRQGLLEVRDLRTSATPPCSSPYRRDPGRAERDHRRAGPARRPAHRHACVPQRVWRALRAAIAEGMGRRISRPPSSTFVGGRRLLE